jgi:L-threonate 2-dehydrogenase
VSLPNGAIGVVGIGNMGLAMALHLRDAGHAVWVRDLRAEPEAVAAAAGAQVAPQAQALAAQCNLVIVAVVDAEQTEAVLFGSDGVAAGLAPGGTVMLCPTIGPADVERLAARLASAGIDAIDAPMSGGPARARDGSMSLMVACDDTLFLRHRALLDTLASRLFHVGTRPGDGARTKLVNNLLAAVNLAGAAEALALAGQLGLDGARTLAVIEQSSGQSWIGSDRLHRALAGDLAPRAHTTLLAKDSALALAMAAGAGFATPMGGQAAALFRAACEAGCATLDDASLLSFLARAGSTGVPADPPVRLPGESAA